MISAAVAEFKGPKIFGVTRLAQVNMQLARIEANFSGLPPGKHGWSINEFGDLTRGAASTGKVFNPITVGKEEKVCSLLFFILYLLPKYILPSPDFVLYIFLIHHYAMESRNLTLSVLK